MTRLVLALAALWLVLPVAALWVVLTHP